MHFTKSLLLISLLVISLFFLSTSKPVLNLERVYANINDTESRSLENYYSQLDLNGDKIADKINFKNGKADVIVIFNKEAILPQDKLFNIPIKSKLNLVPAINIELSSEELQLIGQLDDVSFIEENLPLEPLLTRSTSQLGIRPKIWDLGFTGSSQMSIAIVDTGIDPSHTAFGNRIIASYNAINDNATSPIDDVGHGTHVAGIAAGAQDLDQNSMISTFRGLLPTNECSQTCPVTLSFQVPNLNETTEITVEIDWDVEGEDFTGSEIGIFIFDPISLNCIDCSTRSNTGKLTKTFTVPAGGYYIGFVNYNNASDLQYEAWANYNIDSTLNLEDSYPKAAGVAYTTNLVNVKVIDSQENGDVLIFDKAAKWIIDNKELYNISVVNLSVGISSISRVIDTAVRAMVNNGIVVVAAAGNDGINSGGIFSPGSAPDAITVGAVNYINELTYYSSKGNANVNQLVIKPDVLAPGGSSASVSQGFTTNYSFGMGLIFSTDANLGYNLQPNDLTPLEGTSMSSPHIAGLASLMAQYISENEGWDWDSPTNAIRIKRLILAGTFEVANIGVGREGEPNLNTEGNTLEINRDRKDYQEGWGAVDANSIFSGLTSNVDNGFSENFELSLLDPLANHVYMKKLVTSPGINYGVFLRVPEEVDADLYLISLDEGELIEGIDVGEIKIEKFSGLEKGINEKFGIITDTEKEFLIVVKIIDAPLDSLPLTINISEEEFIPNVKITSPNDGSQINAREVKIEFTSTTGTVDLYLNNQFISKVNSGFILEDLDLGVYTLRLVEITDNGFEDFDEITFTIISKNTPQPSDTNKLLLDNLIYSNFMVLSVIIIIKKRFKFTN